MGVFNFVQQCAIEGVFNQIDLIRSHIEWHIVQVHCTYFFRFSDDVRNTKLKTFLTRKPFCGRNMNCTGNGIRRL